MEGETAQDALRRAAAVAGYREAADRRVIDRVISEDEDGQPRDLPQIDDAALREAMGLF